MPSFGRPDRLYLNDGDGGFEDVAPQSGITAPDDGQGSAAATFADFDADGALDLFVAGAGTRANRLLMNNGDGTFREESADRGLVWPTLADSSFGNQTHDVAVADVNRDGAMDLLVLQWWEPITSSDSEEADDARFAHFGNEGPGDPKFSSCAVSEAAVVRVNNIFREAFGTDHS